MHRNKKRVASQRKRAPASRPRRGARLLRKQEVCARLSVSNSSLYRMIAAGQFTPIRLGPTCRSIRFDESEVDAFIAARVAARDGGSDA